MNIMSFYDFRSEQAQTLKVTFSKKTKPYHSQTCFNNMLRIYLNEKLNFYHDNREKCSNAYKIRKSVSLD